HRFHAVVLEALCEIHHVVAGELGPAVGGDLPVLRIEAHDDVAREGVACLVQEARVLHRGRTDHDVRHAIVEVALDRVQVADAAAQLHRDVRVDVAHDVPDGRLVARLAGPGAVKVHDVDAPSAL